jgi:hypothetical protein
MTLRSTLGSLFSATGKSILATSPLIAGTVAMVACTDAGTSDPTIRLLWEGALFGICATIIGIGAEAFYQRPIDRREAKGVEVNPKI